MFSLHALINAASWGPYMSHIYVKTTLLTWPLENVGQTKAKLWFADLVNKVQKCLFFKFETYMTAAATI